MARILYFGPPSAVRLPANASAADLLSRLGRNTGNLLIGDAIQRHLAASTIVRLGDLQRVNGEHVPLESLDPTLLETSFDRIVIGAANFLHERFDFGPWARLLEAVRLPCVIIGLGAQAPSYDDAVNVPAGTRRMVQIVAERSTTLGVRGHFTAATLDRIGITNVRVIGCPSMYWSCQPALQLRRVATRECLAVSVNGSANVVAHAVDVSAATRVEAMIARLALDRGYPYVLQNETELMDILIRAPETCDQATLRTLAGRYGLADLSTEQFVQYVRTHMKVYLDIGTWLADVKPFDLVLGTRFHGCLIGILAGVPGFMFVHDARTREMCELLRMPSIDVRAVDNINVDDIYDTLDLEPLKSSYSRLYQNYLEFLDENGLAHRLSR